jgi:ketol-acid reductoisomerase
MAEVRYDDDADLRVVQARNVAVLGYGSQGSAQALSLRDSGVDVRVGLLQGSATRVEAESAGLRVVSPYEACEEADLMVVLVPDQAQRSLYTEAIEPNLVTGDTLVFGHGFNVRYRYIQPPTDVDVVLVSPTAPGQLVRREFEAGRGVPVLVAVDQDASGGAWDLALSYAKAIGATRGGAITTTFTEQTDADLFGEQVVLSGGVSALVQAGVETLTEAGCQPEVAYLECLHGLRQVVDRMYGVGLAEQRSSRPELAEYAGYTAGSFVIDESVKHRMHSVLARIQDGSWAAGFIADHDAGGPKLIGYRDRSEQHPVEQTSRELRQLMSWAHSTDDTYGTDAR